MMNSKYNFELTESNRQKEQIGAEKEGAGCKLLMPPPNITGNLHLGHILNLVLQDFLVRSTRGSGKNVYWISGFDHAGIATQSVLEKSQLLTGKNRQEKVDFVLTEWYPSRREKFIAQ